MTVCGTAKAMPFLQKIATQEQKTLSALCFFRSL
jgi:hypothetical protein